MTLSQAPCMHLSSGSPWAPPGSDPLLSWLTLLGRAALGCHTGCSLWLNNAVPLAMCLRTGIPRHHQLLRCNLSFPVLPTPQGTRRLLLAPPLQPAHNARCHCP